MKNILDGLNSQEEAVRVSRILKVNQLKLCSLKTRRKNKVRLRAMWNNIKENEIPVTEFPKGEEGVNGAEIIPEEVKAEKNVKFS